MNTNEKAHDHAHDHPSASTFWKIGAVLFVITAIEFGIVYLEGFRTIVVTILFALSAVKFWLVGSYFMHLKFEKSKLLSWIFVAGVVLALLMAIAQKYVNLT